MVMGDKPRIAGQGNQTLLEYAILGQGKHLIAGGAEHMVMVMLKAVAQFEMIFPTDLHSLDNGQPFE